MKGLLKRRELKSSLEKLLTDIMDDVEGVKAAQLSADTGQPFASALPPTTDDMRFAAVTAALCSLSERAIDEMGLGKYEQLYVKGTKGYILILRVDEEKILTLSTIKDIKLAPILHRHLRRLREEERKLINNPAPR